MVRVDSEQNVRFPDEQNRVTKNSQNNVNSELSNAFNSNKNSEDLCINSSQLKAKDLNFVVFPKANRADAAHFAERSLNEIRDLVRDFNSDFPDKSYVVNENDFPRPEDFPKKNYGGKDKAYNAWKNAVTEWVEDIKQDLALKKSTHLSELSTTIDMYTKEINAKLDRNYFANEIAEGVTRQFIVDTYVALKGNLSAVEAAVHKEASRIREEVRDTGNDIVWQIDEHTRGIHEHIYNSTTDIKKTIKNDGEYTRNKIDETRDELVNSIETEGDKTRDTVRTETKETQEINSLSDAISNAINGIKTKSSLNPSLSVHTEKTIQRVETLKQRIITTKSITHKEKIQLLTNLRDLVIKDNWITYINLYEIEKQIGEMLL